MTVVETFEVEGHIVDSLILAKILDLILDAGADYRLVDVDIGRTTTDTSRARIEITADDDDALDPPRRAAAGARRQPASSVERRRARRRPTSTACCPPASTRTTNLATEVRIDGHWVPVEQPGDGLRPRRRDPTAPRCARCRCTGSRAGDQIVVGRGGVRVHAPPSSRGALGVRVHGLRGVVGEAQGAARRSRSPSASARPATRGRQGARGVRPGGRPHRRRARRRPARARRLDRRALRRQRLRHPRHRVERARHVARRVGRRRAPAPRAGTATTCG